MTMSPSYQFLQEMCDISNTPGIDQLEIADRILRRAAELQKSGHLTLSTEQNDQLLSLRMARQAKHTEDIQRVVLLLKAKMAMSESQQKAQAERTKKGHDPLKLLEARLRAEDEELRSLQQRISAMPKLTPANAQKVLSKIRKRMYQETAIELLDRAQASTQQSAKKKEAWKVSFFDAIVTGVAQQEYFDSKVNASGELRSAPDPHESLSAQ